MERDPVAIILFFRDFSSGERMVNNENSPIMVLGMHRSGTSCLAGSLQHNGLYLGDVHTWNPYNVKGNRENEKIINLNDDVMKFSGGSWDNPPTEIKWLNDHIDIRDEVIRDLQRANRAWGFKDPRTLITLPFWKDGIKNPQFVGTFRHPHAVASSLAKRSRMPLEVAVELWNTYNSKLLSIYETSPFPLISFDVTEIEYQQRVVDISHSFGLPYIPNNNDFFDSKLRHNDNNFFDSEYTIPNHIITMWTYLRDLYQEQINYGKN